jgi:hypothetical protein
VGLCCVRRAGLGMEVVVLNAMRRGALTCLKNSPSLGSLNLCGKRAVDFLEKELFRVETW